MNNTVTANDSVQLTDSATTAVVRGQWETDAEDSMGLGAPARVLVPAFFVVDTPDEDAAMARASDEVHAINARALHTATGVRIHLCEASPNTILANAKLADPRALTGFVVDAPAPVADDEVSLRFKVSNRLCSDVLCCAFEGGTGYWGVLDEIHRATTEEAAARGLENGDYLSARMEDTEAQEEDDTPSFEPFTADFALVRRGIQRMLSEGGVRRDIIDAVRAAVAEDDAGQIDADCADAIVQLGAFNELVFG